MLADTPRTIWFHWMQGRAHMPPVVRACLSSWVEANPDWNVVVVDGLSIWNYLERDAVPVDQLLKTSPQVYANAIRLSLLNTHGGVWADATTWCRTPLSDWLTTMPGEFFAFSSPGPDRMMSNWFLAAHKSAHVVEAMVREYLGIFRRLGPLTLLTHAAVHDILERAENTDVLVEPLIAAKRRDYPYFLFHYLFAFLYRRDDTFRRSWDAAPKIGAEASHVAQGLNLCAPATESTRQRLKAANPHVHKLVWDIDRIEPGSVLHDIVTRAV